MVDKSIRMVISIWKYSKTLQVVIITMNKVVGQVTRSKGSDPIRVKTPKYIITYQQPMGGFDRGD